MWPLDAFISQEVIRIGPMAIELWKGSTSGMVLVDRMPLAQRCSMYDAQRIVEPLCLLCKQLNRSRVSLILESAFAPTLLADTGGSLWNEKQVEALLRHRFGLAYGAPDTDVATWRIRAAYRFGERYALGFAMAPAVKDALRTSSTTAKVKFAAWSPALAWGLHRFSPSRERLSAVGWWVWAEQDRCLVASVLDGRLNSLNAAIALPMSNEGVEQLVGAEGDRQGIDSAQSSIGYAHWSSVSRLIGPPGRVKRFSVETIDRPTSAAASARPKLSATS